MPVSLIETQNQEELTDRGANLLADAIRNSIAEDGTCVLGLSGGSTPRPIYIKLSTINDIDWSKVWIFLVDDRYISADDDESNIKLVQDTLLSTLSNFPADNFIHPDTMRPIDDCVAHYDQMLHTLFKKHGIPDVVTLGIGEDGHISSLFPPVTDDAIGPKLVIHTTTDRFAVHDRISMTLPTLRQTPHVLFFLKGAGKQKVWQEMMASQEDFHRWPAKFVMEFGQTTVVILPS